MTTLIHCDGPGCDEVRNPDIRDDRMCGTGWTRTADSDDRVIHDFHSRECLARWSAGER